MQEIEESRAKLDTKTEGESFGNMVPTQKRFFWEETCVPQAKFVLKGFFLFPSFPQRNCRLSHTRVDFWEVSAAAVARKLFGVSMSRQGFGKKKKKGTICVAIYSKLWDFGFCTLAVLQKVKKAFSQCFQAFFPRPNCSKHLPRKKRRGPFQYMSYRRSACCVCSSSSPNSTSRPKRRE